MTSHDDGLFDHAVCLSHKYHVAVSDVWTKLSTTGGPSARSGHSAVWCPDLNAMLVFGGYNGNYRLNDVWSWSEGECGGAAVARGNHIAVTW